MDEPDLAKLEAQSIVTECFLDEAANTLDKWAIESRSGGWSTHQVKANEELANQCRRQAAQLRSARK